jgi:hypothetical protein
VAAGAARTHAAVAEGGAMIETLGDLKDELANYSHRSDLSARFPTFIQLAEKDINRELLSDYSLSDAADSATIELLVAAPDVYLFAALVHLAIYTHDPEKQAEWGGLYARALQSAKYYEFVSSGEADKLARMDDISGPSVFDIVRG